MDGRYRKAIVPDPPADFVVCTECVVGIPDTKEAKDQHDLYHDYPDRETAEEAAWRRADALRQYPRGAA
jgi:hypothetical protein